MCEPLSAGSGDPRTTCQPALGAATEIAYHTHSFELSLRERIILAVDDPLTRPTKAATGVVADLSRLNAEAHRRMTAADALALVRETYSHNSSECATIPSVSVTAIRRR
jgi:hypothetical protein